MTSVRIGDLKRAQRKTGGSKKLIIALVILIVLLVGAGAGYIYLSHSSFFAIEEISVKGAEHLTADDVAELADVPEHTTLLNVDTEGIKQRFCEDAWVQDVTIHRSFPHTLVIDVTERTIAAVAEVPSSDARSTRNWAISSDGVWLMPIPEPDSEAGALVNPKIYEDAEAVLHITDIPYGEQPEIGTHCSDPNVNCAIEIVSGLTTDLSDQVRTVKATDSASTTLLLDNGVEIAFGDAESIREKERICIELLKNHEGKITYINVRSPENPTWRGID